MQAVFGVLALVVNLIGYFPYIRSILRGEVRPQRITWGIWAVLTSIVAVNQVANHGGYSSLFLISTTLLVWTTFLLSLKRGLGGASRTDLICLALAAMLFVYWATLRDTRLSTLIAVVIDAIGIVPTLIKTYHRPGTETYIQWVCSAFAGLLAMLAVTRLDRALLVYPAYVFIGNGAIIAIKYGRERRKEGRN